MALPEWVDRRIEAQLRAAGPRGKRGHAWAHRAYKHYRRRANNVTGDCSRFVAEHGELEREFGVSRWTAIAIRQILTAAGVIKTPYVHDRRGYRAGLRVIVVMEEPPAPPTAEPPSAAYVAQGQQLVSRSPDLSSSVRVNLSDVRTPPQRARAPVVDPCFGLERATSRPACRQLPPDVAATPAGAVLLAEYGRQWTEAQDTDTASRPTPRDASKAAALACRYAHADLVRAIRAWLAGAWASCESDPDHLYPFALFAAAAHWLVPQTRRQWARATGGRLFEYACHEGNSSPSVAAARAAHVRRVCARLAAVTDAAITPLCASIRAELEALDEAAIAGGALVALDQALVTQACETSAPAARDTWTAEAAAALASYRARMEPDAYARALTAAQQQICREALRLPVVAY